jgi:hypothetical protein
MQIWGSSASLFRRHQRTARVEPALEAPTTRIEPLAFPQDTETGSETQRRLDWFSTDLYAFGLDKIRQG